MEPNNTPNAVSKETLWYLDNYILLRDYYDRTISRIAARCVRMGNIAMEEYPFYGYILDVLEEISETGEFILQHKELYPYVDKKIPGGVQALRKNLSEYQQELHNNSSPDMIKEDAEEIERMKAALGEFEQADDPTKGAGMNMDQVMEKLMAQDKEQKEAARQATPQQPAAQGAQASQGEAVLKKVIKIKRPVNPEAAQAIPPKDEGSN